MKYSASDEEWAPNIRWFAPEGTQFADNYTESDFKKHNAVINSSVVVEITAKLDGALLNSEIQFVAPVGRAKGYATNNPEYSFAWYSRPLNVQCKRLSLLNFTLAQKITLEMLSRQSAQILAA